MKAYKINGHEIITYDHQYGNVYKERSVKEILEQLLEALSDKEECKHGNNLTKGYCLKCYNETIKPKQEKCTHNKANTCPECPHINGECNCEKQEYHNKYCKGKPKQSTSLKEETLKIVRTVADVQAEPVTDKIISLFKTHLLEEIEKTEPDKYVQMDSECLEGYTICKEQIKSLIKNI